MSTSVIQVDSNESALVLVEKMAAVELFNPVTINPILDRIKQEVRAIDSDISTDKGRKAVASLAYKVARTKTFIESQRVALVADEKKRLAAIDAEGKRIRDELDSLKDEVRKPLTDWEDAEKSRIARHEEAIAWFAMPEPAIPPTTAELKARIAEVESRDTSTFEEFCKRAEAAKLNSLTYLRTKLAASEKLDAEREELERLRKEQQEREQREREAAIAAKAAADAEAKAARAIKEKEEAEARAVAAEARAKADAEAAVERERQRVEAEKKAAEEAEAKREANKKHVSKINSDAVTALVSAGITPEAALIAIETIAAGKVPNVRISY